MLINQDSKNKAWLYELQKDFTGLSDYVLKWQTEVDFDKRKMRHTGKKHP